MSYRLLVRKVIVAPAAAKEVRHVEDRVDRHKGSDEEIVAGAAPLGGDQVVVGPLQHGPEPVVAAPADERGHVEGAGDAVRAAQPVDALAIRGRGKDVVERRAEQRVD